MSLKSLCLLPVRVSIFLLLFEYFSDKRIHFFTGFTANRCTIQVHTNGGLRAAVRLCEVIYRNVSEPHYGR